MPIVAAGQAIDLYETKLGAVIAETGRACGGAWQMPIDRILRQWVFGRTEILLVTTAYEDALRVLRLQDRDDPVTELIAKKIIELTQIGERDPIRIRERALTELGIPSQY